VGFYPHRTSSERRPARLLAYACALGVGLAAPAGADIINPSFETGNTSGWNTVGDVSVVTSSFGVTPTDATYQILLTTGSGSVTTSATESAMGLGSGVLQSIFDNDVTSTGSGPTEGSAFQQTFEVTATGDKLSFDFNFLTDASVPESVSTDFLWWHLDRPVGADTSGVIAHANQAGFSSSGSIFTSETGYGEFKINLNQAGFYTLTIGVHDVDDTLTDTGAVIDNFRLAKTPEPNTFLLLTFGLVGLAWASRR
jgi:hypothetical protein